MGNTDRTDPPVLQKGGGAPACGGGFGRLNIPRKIGEPPDSCKHQTFGLEPDRAAEQALLPHQRGGCTLPLYPLEAPPGLCACMSTALCSTRPYSAVCAAVSFTILPSLRPAGLQVCPCARRGQWKCAGDNGKGGAVFSAAIFAQTGRTARPCRSRHIQISGIPMAPADVFHDRSME